MRAEIISVGTEILLGDIVNTNAQYLSQMLSELGIVIYNQQVVGDNPTRLAQAVSLAKQRSDIVVFSGGLGPTDDDLTKQTVAQIYNDELVYSQAVERDILHHFEQMGRQMTDNNKKQAYIPKRGKYIKNENGTAPGIIFIDGEKLAILLPGPPKELVTMVQQDVIPLLKKLVRGTIRSKYVKTIGIGESLLETKISDLLEIENPSGALYAKTGEVTIRLTAKSDDISEAENALRAQISVIDKRISEYIYGVDIENIETMLVQTLKKTMKTVAVAESCTGGLIASKITAIAGASQVFELGLCTYSDKQKAEMLCVSQDVLDDCGAVSAEIAAQMAQNVRTIADSDFGIATTGFAGPTGDKVGLVFVAVATKEKTFVAKHTFAGDRETIIELASQYAFDLLRRVIFNLPQTFAVEFKRDKLKKKASIVKKVIMGIVTLAVILGLAFGLMWLRKEDRWRQLPIISDILNTQSVQNVVMERQQQDFFSEGFEQKTVEFLSSSWAQNLKLKGWISIKDTKKEFAIGTEKLAKKQKEAVVFEDTSIAGMKTLTGFEEQDLFFEQDIETMPKDTAIVLFNTDNTYREYKLFSIAKYTQDEYTGLMKMLDSQNVVDEVTKLSLVDFSREANGFDDIIILSQILPDGSKLLYFANQEGEKVGVDIPTSNPDSTTGTDSDTADDTDAVQGEQTDSDSDNDSSKDNSSSQNSSSGQSSNSGNSSNGDKNSSSSGSSSSKPKPTATPAPTPKPTPEPTPEPTPPPAVDAGTLTVTMNGSVITGPTAEILAKIVSREMTSTWEPEALKAQAVATHTFIKYQQSTGNSAPAVSGRDTPYSQVVAAVNQVADKIMTINGAPVYTPYFASSGGRTNSAAEVWGANHSHLQSVESKHDAQASGYQGTVRFSKADMEQVIRDKIGVEPVGEPSTWIQVLDKTSGNYNGNMSICGATTYNNAALGKVTNITGRWMREDILKVNGSMVMRSACFDVTYDGATFIFTTYGYGHGAGMSQWGAQLYAKNDRWTYDQILNHYYTGVTIQSK